MKDVRTAPVPSAVRQGPGLRAVRQGPGLRAGRRGPALRTVRVAPAPALALAAAAVLGALGTGCSADPAPKPDAKPHPTPPAATASACPEPGVLIKGSRVDAAMGLRSMAVRMTNCGKRPFKVNGYPHLRVLDDKREPLKVRAVKGAQAASDIKDPGPRPLTLRPGEAAETILVWRNTVTDVSRGINNGAFLEVAPAEGQPVQHVRELIDVGTTGKVEMTAWKQPATVPVAPAGTGAG
ncbi:DUF4232 domain-containing protein [Streptomyces sp. MST-110588]|uniref:DUF4232 domain-containing protein n=1 Tax=Streptomyces sp. MST-110588 TaxID=2833628 RepID=UPI001F5D586E|nr:DUF4232 domain-containing protein [Streptomyces sp. MST-110588]UNO40610.1 DUF4232 domain-containing protein [Streptomyces sp. MST-110588]